MFISPCCLEVFDQREKQMPTVSCFGNCRAIGMQSIGVVDDWRTSGLV